jgi:hypothetical protein
MTDTPDVSQDTQPSQPIKPAAPTVLRHRYLAWFAVGDGVSWFERLLVPTLLLIQVLYTGWRVLNGDFLAMLVSLVGIVLLVVVAGTKTVQRVLLRQPFTRSHAFYLMTFWVHSLALLTVVRVLSTIPSTGKDSRFFYIFALLMAALIFRMLLCLFALTPIGYRVFISKLPLWEQILIAVNEFIAASLFTFILGGVLAQILQPTVFTLRPHFNYVAGLLFMTSIYYIIIQIMWVQRWNEWLSRYNVWVRLTRLLAPIALIVMSIVIVRHFTRLSDLRSATLLATADLDQTILALSPTIWMMIFFIVIMVYTGSEGLRRRLIPNDLLDRLPARIANPLRTVSDMDILLIFGVLMMTIPLQVFVFNNTTFLSLLQQRLSGENALIGTSQQALSFIFSVPFYVVAIGLLLLYALGMARGDISARERDHLVERLPITLLIIFIITLYLAAIPFSETLASGELTSRHFNLGFILAYDVLIPLILLYAHYFLFIRLPYGYGQSRWRRQHARKLDDDLSAIDKRLNELQVQIQQGENIWTNRANIRTNQTEQIDMLHDLIFLNGERDRLNMERLAIVRERQELAEVSETPVSLAVARLPVRVFRLGIPLVLAFKIYEWAIVNDGLRQVASNPNIGVLEFFREILENTNF